MDLQTEEKTEYEAKTLVEEPMEPTESRSAYQKRKRAEEKQAKRKIRKRVVFAITLLVMLAGIACGTAIAKHANSPYDAVQIASANAQYMKYTVTDKLSHWVATLPLDKLPWNADGSQGDKDTETNTEINTETNQETNQETEKTEDETIDFVPEPEIEPTTPEEETELTETPAIPTDPSNPFGIDPKKPMVALTFDDGPSKYTWDIVTTLYEHNARATFFLVGERIASHQAAIEFTLANHNEIASHSFNHFNLAEISEEEILQEIQKVDTILLKQHNYKPSLFRVPYGDRSDQTLQILRQEGKPVIGWSVDPRDWESQDKDAIVDHVLRRVKDGDIILMHDLYKPTADAVAELVPALQERGYQLVTVSELFQYKGIQLVPGTYYYATWKWQ